MLNGAPGLYGVAAPRILIVDDDPNLLVILADQLRADGYQVQTARDGEEALRRLETQRFRAATFAPPGGTNVTWAAVPRNECAPRRVDRSVMRP